MGLLREPLGRTGVNETGVSCSSGGSLNTTERKGSLMPQCNKCDRVAATVEMRRSPKQGWLCKDWYACKIRRGDKRLLADIARAS